MHPLHIAAEQGHLQLCKHIVEKIGDSNTKQNLSSCFGFNSFTALHFAAVEGNLEAYKFILNNVDDIFKQPLDKQGYSPYDYAFQNGQLELCRFTIKTLGH